MILRPECDDDLAFLRQLYASTRTGEMALVDWNDAQKDQFLLSQFEAQHHHYLKYYPASRFDLIEYNGVAVGRIYVAFGSDEILIIDIALLPEYRGRGLGGEVLASLLRQAAVREENVKLHVEKFNPAVHLYERLGFKSLGEEEDGINLLMEWRPFQNISSR